MLNAQRLFHDKLFGWCWLPARQAESECGLCLISVDFLLIERLSLEFFRHLRRQTLKEAPADVWILCVSRLFRIHWQVKNIQVHFSAVFSSVNWSPCFFLRASARSPWEKTNSSMEFASLVQIRAISSGGDILLTASDVEVWGLWGFLMCCVV